MPNYCNGKLEIQCSEYVFEKIKYYVQSENSAFDFNKIIPMPEHIYRGSLGPEEEKKYGKDNWYDWSNEFWGTKWNAVDAHLDGSTFYFLTARSPCSPVIAALAAHFPEATIRYTYSEASFCFCGVEEYRNGRITYTLNGEYYEYYRDRDEVTTSDSIFNHLDIGCQNEKYVPEVQSEDMTGGKLYLSENYDGLWGYEIDAIVIFKGEQPSYWWKTPHA